MLLIFCVIGAVAPCFDLVSVLIPLVFPRIGVAMRPFVDKRAKGTRDDQIQE